MTNISLPYETLLHICSHVRDLPTISAIGRTCKEGLDLLSDIGSLYFEDMPLSRLQLLATLFPNVKRRPVLSGFIVVDQELDPFPVFPFLSLTIIYQVQLRRPEALLPLFTQAQADPQVTLSIYDQQSNLVGEGERGFISEYILYTNADGRIVQKCLSGPKLIIRNMLSTTVRQGVESLWLRASNGRNVWDPRHLPLNVEVKELILDLPWSIVPGAFPNLERVEGPLFFPPSFIVEGKVPEKLNVCDVCVSSCEVIDKIMHYGKKLYLWVPERLVPFYQRKYRDCEMIIGVRPIAYCLSR